MRRDHERRGCGEQIHRRQGLGRPEAALQYDRSSRFKCSGGVAMWGRMRQWRAHQVDVVGGQPPQPDEISRTLRRGASGRGPYPHPLRKPRRPRRVVHRPPAHVVAQIRRLGVGETALVGVAEGDDPLQCRMWLDRAVGEQPPGSGILEHVPHLSFREERVDRDRYEAGSQRSGRRLQRLDRVPRQDRDAFALREPRRTECSREPPLALV